VRSFLHLWFLYITLNLGLERMKKILVATTALIGASLVASAADAADLKVAVGGFADFQVGIMEDDLDGNQRAQGFRNDTEVTFSVDGVADNGLMYGANIDLEADVSADADNEGLNASRTYLHLGGDWGRVEMGSNTGAAGTLKVDASNLARATGGIDGDWYYFANTSGAQFIATPDLPVGYGSGSLGSESSDNDNKVTYYSPRFSGFQIGASYIPDISDRGQAVFRADNNDAGDIFQVGVNYEGKFDMFGLAAAATGEWGDAELAGAEDLEAWNAGAMITFSGFSLAASYGDWDDSLSANNTDADYWTLGGAYDFGPFGASITYLDSDYGNNDFENLSIGADYKLAEGLTPYAEISFYDQDPAGAIADNDGTVFIVGSQLAF